MKKQDQFYALQATMPNGKKLLCWKDKKHFYFAEKKRGFANPPAPTLFKSRKEANTAMTEVPSKGGNMNQFQKVIEATKVKVIGVVVSQID